MFIDVVIPKDNEKEFIKVAKKLDVGGIIFLYEKFDKEIKEKIEKLNSKDFKVYSGFLLKDLKHALKIKSNYDFIFSNGERSHFENKNVDIIIDLEDKNFRDATHFRNSGLNQVLAKLAKEKSILIGINFNLVLNNKNKELIIGRISQNIKLCRKYKLDMFLASFAKKPYELRYWNDLVSFGVTIGMHPSEAKTSISNRKV